jgi:hypothetical protein
MEGKALLEGEGDMEEQGDMTHLSILHPRYFLVSILHSPLFPPLSFRHLRYPIMNSLHSPCISALVYIPRRLRVHRVMISQISRSGPSGNRRGEDGSESTHHRDLVGMIPYLVVVL